MNETQVLFIASMGIISEWTHCAFCLSRKKSTISIYKAAFLHLMLDALTSFCVVLSALIVCYGGYQWIDSLMALIIAAVIAISGWRLLHRSLNLLLSRSTPSHINLEEVNQYLMNYRVYTE